MNAQLSQLTQGQPDYFARLKQQQACAALIKSGQRKGSICLKNGIWQLHGLWYCHHHKPNMNRNALCTFAPNGLPFNAIETTELTESRQDDENLLRLNGYCNIRVDQNVLFGTDKLPLALMTQNTSGNPQFTKRSIVQELKNSLEFVFENPDIYNLAGYSLDELKIEAITYDDYYHIYVAEIIPITTI